MTMQNKLFGTDGVRGKANVYPMTAEVALKLGQAAAQLFSGEGKQKKVIIGKDTRLSGYIFEYALTSGLCAMGCDVYQVGPLPTPAIAHLTKSFAADAGIVISASHNPAGDNGIKFFSSDGYKLPDEVEQKMEALVAQNEFIPPDQKKLGKAYKIEDARGRYVEYVKNSADNISLKGLKIVLDCAHGAAYSVAPEIFSELGADIVLVGAQPDGLNINKGVGSTNPEIVQKLVVEHAADVGIALDGDADRVFLVDENGDEVDGDEIIAIAAASLKARGKLKKNMVVSTVMANLGFIESLKKLDIGVSTTAVGDRYVIEEMRKHDYSLGGEQSGHIIFSDYSTTGDGTLTALQILRIMRKSGKKLSELKQVMKKFPQTMINVEVKEKKPLAEMPTVMNQITDVTNKLGKQGRVLVRYSGTQNVCRVMLEGEDQKIIDQYAHEIADTIKAEVGA